MKPHGERSLNIGLLRTGNTLCRIKVQITAIYLSNEMYKNSSTITVQHKAYHFSEKCHNLNSLQNPYRKNIFCSLSNETLQYLFLPAVYKVLLIRVIPIPDYGVLKEVVWIYFKTDEYTFVVIKQENEHHSDNLDEDKKCHQMGVLQKKKIFLLFQSKRHFLITRF